MLKGYKLHEGVSNKKMKRLQLKNESMPRHESWIECAAKLLERAHKEEDLERAETNLFD